MPDARAEVLYVCVHNAGRSQMAAAFTTALSGGAVAVRSAGSAPGERVNPMAAEAMREIGLSLDDAFPKKLTDEAVRTSDVVITMGCGDTCPIFPGTRYLDWAVDDPAGQDIAVVRGIRDDIRRRVLTLLDELGVPAVGCPTCGGPGPDDLDTGPTHCEWCGAEYPVPGEDTTR